MSHGWAPGPTDQPLPPQNGQVISPFLRGMLDIRWDDPAILARNAAWTVVGVNVYRSDGTDRGPYHRLNALPLGGTFYRDVTDLTKVTKEVVNWNTSWISKGDNPNNRQWSFRTKNSITKRVLGTNSNQSVEMANAPTDVTVYIDGVEVPVDDVFGSSGEVTLVNTGTYDLVTEKNTAAVLPSATSSVTVTYWTARNHVRSGLETNLFYRLTTVVIDTTTPSGYRETALGYCPPLTVTAVESMDYIWAEAVRRNHWILQQGGERVKVFVRKQSGVPCSCKMDDRTRQYNKQPSSRCVRCYGSGFLGGYEGPYDIIVAPDDAERRIAQTQFGRRKEHTYEVWTGPSPLMTQRDFLVKQTNERYSVGAVRRPTNRGNLLQQHFNIGYIDEQDIRYQVPVDGPDITAWPETRYGRPYYPPQPVDGALPDTEPHPVSTDTQVPMETEKDSVPDERQRRGRSPVWENQNY